MKFWKDVKFMIDKILNINIIRKNVYYTYPLNMPFIICLF